VALSRPYYAAPSGSRSAVAIRSAAVPGGARGRRVGTLPGSLAERMLSRAGADVRTYDGGQNEIYADLALGRTDAVLLDAPIARYYGEIEPALEVLAPSFGEVRYAIALERRTSRYGWPWMTRSRASRAMERCAGSISAGASGRRDRGAARRP